MTLYTGCGNSVSGIYMQKTLLVMVAATNAVKQNLYMMPTTIVFIGSILTLQDLHVLLTCHVTADYSYIQVQKN